MLPMGCVMVEGWEIIDWCLRVKLKSGVIVQRKGRPQDAPNEIAQIKVAQAPP
jgi:hypothetical protein